MTPIRANDAEKTNAPTNSPADFVIAYGNKFNN